MTSPAFVGVWRRLPVVVRAIVVGFPILVIGGGPPGVLLVANLRLSPAVPWFVHTTGVWLFAVKGKS